MKVVLQVSFGLVAGKYQRRSITLADGVKVTPHFDPRAPQGRKWVPVKQRPTWVPKKVDAPEEELNSSPMAHDGSVEDKKGKGSAPPLPTMLGKGGPGKDGPGKDGPGKGGLGKGGPPTPPVPTSTDGKGKGKGKGKGTAQIAVTDEGASGAKKSEAFFQESVMRPGCSQNLLKPNVVKITKHDGKNDAWRPSMTVAWHSLSMSERPVASVVDFWNTKLNGVLPMISTHLGTHVKLSLVYGGTGLLFDLGKPSVSTHFISPKNDESFPNPCGLATLPKKIGIVSASEAWKELNSDERKFIPFSQDDGGNICLMNPVPHLSPWFTADKKKTGRVWKLPADGSRSEILADVNKETEANLVLERTLGREKGNRGWFNRDYVDACSGEKCNRMHPMVARFKDSANFFTVDGADVMLTNFDDVWGDNSKCHFTLREYVVEKTKTVVEGIVSAPFKDTSAIGIIAIRGKDKDWMRKQFQRAHDLRKKLPGVPYLCQPCMGMEDGTGEVQDQCASNVKGSDGWVEIDERAVAAAATSGDPPKQCQ